MKIQLALMSLVLAVASCSKPQGEIYSKNASNLIGKWRYVEQYVSIGGPGTWQPVWPAGQTIEFKADGRFVGSGGFQLLARSYVFVDSASVRLTPASNDSGYVKMGYILSNNNNQLELFPLAPYMCIEGCSSKFVRE